MLWTPDNKFWTHDIKSWTWDIKSWTRLGKLWTCHSCGYDLINSLLSHVHLSSHLRALISCVHAVISSVQKLLSSVLDLIYWVPSVNGSILFLLTLCFILLSEKMNWILSCRQDLVSRRHNILSCGH